MTQTPEPWTPGVHRRCAEGAEHLAALAIEAGRISEQYYWLSVAAVHREADRAEKRPPRNYRTPSDYAIEFGRYLATAAEGMLVELNRAERAGEEPESEYWSALSSAVYEFRKRADRAEQRPC